MNNKLSQIIIKKSDKSEDYRRVLASNGGNKIKKTVLN